MSSHLPGRAWGGSAHKSPTCLLGEVLGISQSRLFPLLHALRVMNAQTGKCGMGRGASAMKVVGCLQAV